MGYSAHRNEDAQTNCPFCSLEPPRILLGDKLMIAIRDRFPISPRHTLIIPRRHVGSFFELSPDERIALLAMLDIAKADIEKELQPAGFNIGINDGPAAGQTVPHLHVHLIPRFHGDCGDPRGGVRWVLPTNARYWD